MTQCENITVVVGRFDAVVARGLGVLLRDDPRISVLGHDLEYPALDRAVAEQMPRVAILDEAERIIIDRLKSSGPRTGVLVFAHDPAPAYGESLLATGVTCIARSASGPDLLAAVHLTARGGHTFVCAAGRRLGRVYPSDATPLTRREMDVFRRLSEGKSHAQVAWDLKINVRTVESHAAQISRKLDVQSRRDLIGMSGPSDGG